MPTLVVPGEPAFAVQPCCAVISVLIEGTLHADPMQRVIAKGAPYVTAQIRATGDDGETVWCSVIAFDAGAVESLAMLAAGDAIAITGHASVSVWQAKDGERRAGLKVTVSRVMSVYEAGKRRGASGNASQAQGR